MKKRKVYFYDVECPTCHKIRTKQDNKVTDCPLCAKRKNAAQAAKTRWKGVARIRHAHFCLGCYETRYDTCNRLKLYCGKCARYHIRRYKWDGSFNLTTMKWDLGEAKEKFFRVCEVCGDRREVKSKQSAQAKRCRTHSVGAKKGTTQKPRKRKNKVSRKQIDEARKLNKEHREYVASLVEVPKQKASDADMVAKWLENNEPSVVVKEDTPLEAIQVREVNIYDYR